MEEADEGQSPADGAEGAPAEPGRQEQAEVTGGHTGPLTATVEAITAPPAQGKRRGRAVLMAVSVALLAASLAATLYIGGGGAEGFLLIFSASSPTARATDLPATPFPTLPPATATSTATSTATPALVGDGAPPPSGTYPPYSGPITGGQGCPSGQAPKPVGWAIRGASDYGAPPASVVALTFDDGPTPYYTPAILSYLEQTHTPATFFVLGQYAKAYPWLVQREAADGFTIGIHTWSHPDMRLLTPAQRAWQLAATAQQLHADLGANACLWLWRPPYGSYNSTIVAQAGTFGLTTIMWNDDPADWSQPGTMTIVNRVLSNVRPGSIILLHDGPAGRAQTLAALPYILAGLRQRGLTPVSLPQLLLGYHAPTPTATPTSTLTPAPTPSPTGVATPTDTPMPTDTPSPTATDTPSPVPSPT
ncbi:MAG TPA: polysaccharide deacetylase family protein [Ktedonobacterales bacterium]|nr:polysaccharide deacetylase family protein [Ktedonobacterales bacterium]